MRMDNSQQKFEDTYISLLKRRCAEGKYQENLFKKVIIGGKYNFPLEKIEWMRDYVNHENQLIGAGCIEVLCRKGVLVSEFQSLITENFHKKVWCEKIIQMAELQDDPVTIISFLEEDSGYINRAVLALKKTNHKNYLTSLLLSNNKVLAKAINRIIKNDSQK